MSKLKPGKYLICTDARKEREISDKAHLLLIHVKATDEDTGTSIEFYTVMLPKKLSFKTKDGKLMIPEWLARAKEKEMKEKFELISAKIVIEREKVVT